MDGRPVRLAGQDSRRGTFVSRFATIIDRTNANEWTPLANLTEDQAQFYVYDSLLSEYAALGFEYGYSVARPDALVVWEAQFGDFVNGAQIVIDEFITSCADQVGPAVRRRAAAAARLRGTGSRPLLGAHRAVPDHGGRRRVRGRPAVDPGELLPPAAPARARRGAPPADRVHAEVDAQAQGGGIAAGGLHGGLGFRTVTPDAIVDPEKVRTLLLCSGRITWDLMVERGKRQGDELTTAIARVEQLYPHPTDALKAEIARYPHLEHVRWVQDEPVNMGPAPFYRLNVFADLAAEGHEVEVIARPASSSPSVGQHSRHVEEQKSVLERAFA